MKKVLASVLAVSMAASMTSMAFAVDATSIKVDNSSKLYKDNDGSLVEVSPVDLTAKPGQTIYVEILPGNPGEEITSKVAGQHKVLLDWNVGKELVESAEIESKKVTETTGKYIYKEADAPYELAEEYESLEALKAAVEAVKVHTDADCEEPECDDDGHFTALSEEEQKQLLADFQAETATSYKYLAAIKLKSSYSTKKLDLLGSVKVVKKTSGNHDDISSKDINAVVGYDSVSAGDSMSIDNDAPVVDFEGIEDEIEILFSNTASFTVNAKGQGDLYLGYSVKPITSVIDQNEEANIDFISFPAKPSFNRMGQLRLFASEGSYVYEMGTNGLKKVEATYDEDYEAYVIETRTLGSYVIADRELKYTVDNTDTEGDNSSSSNGSSSGSTENGGSTGKPSNPNTGASNMVNVAAALAAVSLAIAGAAGYKKSVK